jgi:nucleoside-diphosphate-sugar epimerase
MTSPARSQQRVLVTGDEGYIGSVLSSVLVERGYDVIGLDAGYFSECSLCRLEPRHRHVTKDLRDITAADLSDVTAIVHLAALSNDPLGELAPNLTDEINRDATARFAMLAKAAGIARFVFASSQSMYGISGTDLELDEDASEKNPLTAYARTKWEAEQILKTLNGPQFTVVCMRPSTVFGASPRLRCDIVFNNLVACAYTTGNIEIKSDGTPWRPVVHIKDVCSAFIAALEAPQHIVAGRSFNVGIPRGNFTVRDLAEAAARAVPGALLTFTGEHGKDSRTYRVSSARILNELGDWYRPDWDLDRGAAELVALFRETGFTELHFRSRITNRLAQLKHLMTAGGIDAAFRWMHE